MNVANDNSQHEGLYEMLSGLTRELNVMLMQGKFGSDLMDAVAQAKALGYSHSDLFDPLVQYQRTPVNADAEARNASIRAEVTRMLGGNQELADGYIRAASFNEAAHQLADYIAVGHDTGTVSKRRDGEEALKQSLVKQLSVEGGIGERQASEMVRRYATAIHEASAAHINGFSRG